MTCLKYQSITRLESFSLEFSFMIELPTHAKKPLPWTVVAPLWRKRYNRIFRKLTTLVMLTYLCFTLGKCTFVYATYQHFSIKLLIARLKSILCHIYGWLYFKIKEICDCQICRFWQKNSNEQAKVVFNSSTNTWTFITLGSLQTKCHRSWSSLKEMNISVT